MDDKYYKPFGDILKNDLPLDKFGAKDFSLTERLDFSGHASGKVTPHLNTEITFNTDKIGNRYNDLTKTQLQGFNDYQFGGKKFNELKVRNLDLNRRIEPIKFETPDIKTTQQSFIHNLPDTNNRINIDSNGYGTDERTSVGYCPNSSKNEIQPGGMLPINDIKIVSNSNTNTSIEGSTSNGYFAPNIDFMKPK